MSRTHTHECTTCRQDYDCAGTLERNHDGFPEVVCDVRHKRGESECEDCATAEKCDWCGGMIANQDHSQCLEDMADKHKKAVAR